MCGIHAAISTSPSFDISSDVRRCLCNRGPDHIGTVQAKISRCEDENTDNALFLNLTSTVLALRGDHVAKQPLLDPDSGSVLCWNGEAWRIRGELVQGNDGEAVLGLLKEASRRGSDVDHILDALRSIEGPFSFIYFEKPTRRLFYGRDRLGRRSLLVRTGATFALSSIAELPLQGWSEVEADGCYSVQLDQHDAMVALALPVRHNWAEDPSLVSLLIYFLLLVLNPNPATYLRRFQALVFLTLQLRKASTDWQQIRRRSVMVTTTW